MIHADGLNTLLMAPMPISLLLPFEEVDHLIVPTICILEVFKRLLQQRDEDAALQAVALMQQGAIVALDDAIALTAAKIGVDLKLPLADSVILATARAHHALVWTQDADFKGVSAVKYVEKK